MVSPWCWGEPGREEGHGVVVGSRVRAGEYGRDLPLPLLPPPRFPLADLSEDGGRVGLETGSLGSGMCGFWCFWCGGGAVCGVWVTVLVGQLCC